LAVTALGAIGAPVTRLEDPPLLVGRGRFADDISFAGQLHMRVVRSPYAHARIAAVDAARARAAPGVAAVWTAADVTGLPPILMRATSYQGLDPYRQPVLAGDTVRYVGEPVAAVFAESPYLAEDAAALVAVEADEMPPVIAADQPPGPFEPGRDTEVIVIRKAYGDVEGAFAAAHAIVELDLAIGRHSGVPLETRGALARHDVERDTLEFHGAAKRPHWVRDHIARMLGRPPSSMHAYEGNVGGGFGIRGELYAEDVLVCLAALRLGRPVKWVEDRREHLIAANHSRQQRHRVRAAVDADGRLLAIDGEFFHDQGAYLRTHGVRVPDMTAGLLLGPYRMPAYRIAGHVRLTNKTPAATYRSPGRFESTFVRERLMDAIAVRIGIDRIEARRRNLIARSEMPYARPLEALDVQVILDSGDYAGLLDKALDRIGWAALQADLKRRRAAGEAVGAGLALFVEKSGLGPVDHVEMSLDADGRVEVVTGASSLGQGVETVIAQICADGLGIDYRRVRVIHGQTDRIAEGFGSHASRTTVMTGEATRIAAAQLRAQVLDAAAGLLQAPAERLDIADGRVVHRDGGASVGLDEIARASRLFAKGTFRADHMNYPYGVQIAVVCVDRETGGVTIERCLTAYDIGRAVNPMLVEGQIVGGFAQGVGGALLEEFAYDDRGQPLAATLADYLMPSSLETPAVDSLITEDAPSPLNGLGVKGAGEAGITPVGAVLASAVDDALGVAGAVTRLPITPERVRAIVERGRE
jgi:CO/xanthine dehydrogenase Mo-binding subunit